MTFDLFDIASFDSPLESDRSPNLEKAAGIWMGYPLLSEGIECNPRTSVEEKIERRGILRHAHYRATIHMMMEAERAGLNGSPLLEAHRVCLELFDPIRLRDDKVSSNSPYGVEWFQAPSRVSDIWPACLGEWRYSLPTAVQEAIRLGEEAFNRLMLFYSVNPNALELPRSVVETDNRGVSPSSPTSTRKRSKDGKKDPSDAFTKIIAALTLHHQYSDGSCLNTEPIGVNRLAKLADVSPSRGSNFFKDKFEGHAQYEALCRRDPPGLIAALKVLNDEFVPAELYGGRPRNEEDCDDE
ncbi:MAG: hypothetical protein U0840_27795 [Gemmataceae bacterium]